MREARSSLAMFVMILMFSGVVGACAKIKQNDPQEDIKARAEAKRQQAACASGTAYDRLKNQLFDAAVAARQGDRSNLDTLADYSLVRMEDPVVVGHDRALDITDCKGMLILHVPPGAERAFDGERQLRTEIEYTAQASADGNGYVYRMRGADPIVAKLANFQLNGLAFRPPPAVDYPAQAARASDTTTLARADATAAVARAPRTDTAPPADERPAPLSPHSPVEARPGPELARRSSQRPADQGGEATVRAFYDALRRGDGQAASANVIPEKRSTRAYSPEGIEHFYGSLPEPIRLNAIAPAANGSYRVRYSYSAGRSRCNGSAIVSLSNRNGRALIRSIRALSGC